MIVQLDEPCFRASPGAQRVKELLYQGKSPTQIASIMRQRHEVIEDWIYEIRKEQMIMASKLTNEQKAEIYRLKKEDGMSQADIARKFDVSEATVSVIIKKQSKPGIINPEFDAAVDEMIADAKTADAENKPEQVEQTAEPVTMTEEHTAEIPEAVIKAVTDRISMLHGAIAANKRRIEGIENQIEEYKEHVCFLEAWLKEVHGA